MTAWCAAPDNGVAISRDEGKERIPAFAGMTNGKLNSGLNRNEG